MDVSKFKVGQQVKVVRKVETEEGWEEVWVDTMDHLIGKTGKVIRVRDDLGMNVVFDKFDTFGWLFPPSALEIVE